MNKAWYYASACVGLALFAACGSDKGTSDGDNAGASVGGASGQGGRGGAGGGHTAGSSGSQMGEAGDTQAGAAGETNGGEGDADAGGRSNTAGNGGAAGSHGGNTSSGGSGGVGGRAGGGGAGGKAGGGPAVGELPGPTVVDQAPITISNSAIMQSDTASVSFAFGDKQGNLIVVRGGLGGFAAKYGPNLAKKWVASPLAAKVTITSAALDDAGDLFFGGYDVPSGVSDGDQDGVVGKLDAAGAQAWLGHWGSTYRDAVTFVAPGPEGSVIATGTCEGQAPGNMPTNAGGNVAMRYESDGKRTWLVQYPKADRLSKPLSDADGNIYIGDGRDSVLKVDANGNPLFQKTGDPYFVENWSVDEHNGNGPAFGPANDKFYDFDGRGITIDSASGDRVVKNAVLSQTSLTGQLLSYRTGATQSATIDSTEGVVWHGSFADSVSSAVAVSNDSIYIAGVYNNTYSNGSTPRPATGPGYVGRYSLDGTQIWFQEFKFDEKSNIDQRPSSYAGLVVDAAGNVIVVANAYHLSGNYTAVWYAFTLSKKDGLPL